jgi:hypothetical protein
MLRTQFMPLAMVLVLALWCPVTGAPENRSYALPSVLILDGVNCGRLRSIDGGSIFADVISEPAGPGQIIKKHIGVPMYEAFAAEVGLNSSPAVYEWIRQSWSMQNARKTGSVLALDPAGTPTSERQFIDVMITETTIPAMDGSSKDPAYITIRFAPQVIRMVSPGAAPAPAASTPPQKAWLACNFRLEIDGIDCSKVSRIESFTVRQKPVTVATGNARDQFTQPGSNLEFPNLKITLASTAAAPFIAWHEDFVVQGNNNESREKAGSLSLLSTDQTKALARIRLSNIGICRVGSAASGSGPDGTPQVTVELYVEKMEFLSGEAAEAPAPTAPPAPPRAHLAMLLALGVSPAREVEIHKLPQQLGGPVVIRRHRRRGNMQ